jgi:segregation and condensation protein B
MSLKAKLEAVIYAAEEPVTLAQLAALFADEALAWKSERDAARVAQSEENEESDEAAEESLPLLDGEELTPVMAAEPAPGPVLEAEQGAEEPSLEAAQLAGSPAPEAETEGDAAETGDSREDDAAKSAEAEARRLARQRDRDVKAVLRELLHELIDDYVTDERGIEIREIAGGYRLATKPECHDAVRSFVKSLKPALKLSLPALETLAVIAYKQPVTAPEVNEIRGVDSSAVFGSLLARKLVTTAGRKQVVGRPILYKTTREFLLRFGLKDVAELPSMEEFEKMAALEFEDAEPAGEADERAEEENLKLELSESAGEIATEQPEALQAENGYVPHD